MQRSPVCLSSEDLERFLHGDLDASRWESAAEHVETCPQCVDRLRGLENDCDYLQALREARAEANDATPNLPSSRFDRASIAAHGWLTSDAYEILEELGRGGMGVVFKACQRQTKRIVALKMIVTGKYADVAEQSRFRTEIELAARLRHPNIVQIYEAGTIAGCPFFSMEYVDGQTLAARLQAGPLPAPAVAALVERLARGVHFAHETRIVHRDLKPANILLDPSASGIRLGDSPQRFEPKIGDFGLAKNLDSPGQTGGNAIMGTPSYMAPEQTEVAGGPIGPAADIYALGTILYELLTGRPPFVAASNFETIRRLRTQEPIPPRQLQPQAPRDLETVCLKCLQKEPGRRYANANELADRLALILEGKPIPDRPIGRIHRTWLWCQRNRTVASLLGLIAFAFVTFATVAGTLAFLAARAETQLATERDKAERTNVDLAAARDLVEKRRADAESGALARAEAYRIAGNMNLATPLYEEAFKLKMAKPGDPSTSKIARFAPRTLVSFQTSDGIDIFVVDSKGALSNLCNSEKTNASPVWSPDGKSIAFHSDRIGVSQIFSMGDDGKNVRQLTDGDFHSGHPTWSADGRTIVFQRNLERGPTVFAMNSDGTQARPVGPGSDPAISPDGRKIAFAKLDGALGYRPYVMNVDGKAVVRLSTTSNFIGGVYPAWSPDSAKIAWSEPVDGKLQIFTADGDGRNARQITNAGDSNIFPSWSPDGRQIAFVRSENGARFHFLANVDGSDPRQLHAWPAVQQFARVSWYPSNRK